MKQQGQRGAFLIIAAVFMLIVLAFLGVVFLTTFTTSTSTSLNEIQATRALALAEGGVEFEQFALAQNLDWYRSATDPFAVTGDVNLGVGHFNASVNIPATKLRAQMTLASTNPIRVCTTDRFSNPSGCIRIEDEFIRYTGLGSTAVVCSGQPPCFTGITRLSAACGGGVQAPHDRGEGVYPATLLVTNMPNNCSDMASLAMAANLKFLSAGTLDIQGEEVQYSGAGSSGGNLVLTGVQRCQGGTAGAAHAPNVPVTPLLIGGGTADVQAEVISTGTVGVAARAVKKTVQR